MRVNKYWNRRLCFVFYLLEFTIQRTFSLFRQLVMDVEQVVPTDRLEKIKLSNCCRIQAKQLLSLLSKEISVTYTTHEV